MKTDIRKEWVDRLRSGRYSQCRGWLQIPGKGHCCLGVLSDIAVDSGIIDSPRWDGDEGTKGLSYDGAFATLHSAVSEWAGFSRKTPDPEVYFEGEWKALSVLNDQGKTFDEIADIIEAQADDWDGLSDADD